MKSLKIFGKLDMQLVEEAIPEPKSDQIRVKVSYVGVCGSDLHYYFDGANGAFIVNEPLIPGHELSGTIDLDPLGEIPTGTAITIHPARFGKEIEGMEHLPHLRSGGSYLGSAATTPHTQGAMSEYIIVERNMIRLLPERLALESAALCEPLAVGIHAINIAGGVTCKQVLISGSGPIGLLAIAAAKKLGALRVSATDVLNGPLERATELGADSVINVSTDRIEPNSFDVVLECSGIPAALSAALVAVRPGGTVVQVGMMGAGNQPITIAPLVSKEIQLRGTFRFNTEIDDAVEMLSQAPEISDVITHTYSIEDAVTAFEMAKNSELSGKVLISLAK